MSERGRVRVEQSHKRIRTYLSGEVIADSTGALLVWEKPYYPTYYVPEADVRMGLLSPMGTSTECPYKGSSAYRSVDTGTAVHEDPAWSYPFPTAESIKIAGLISFYNEKTKIYVDGVFEDRPKTKFS